MPDEVAPEPPAPPIVEDAIAFRVRYPEVDAMGYVHHSRYLQYFEMGRVELLRRHGFSYADLERAGVFFVVTKAEVKYQAPARYDDQLQLTTTPRQADVRPLRPRLRPAAGDAPSWPRATTTIACVGRDGQVMPIPETLRGG